VANFATFEYNLCFDHCWVFHLEMFHLLEMTVFPSINLKDDVLVVVEVFFDSACWVSILCDAKELVGGEADQVNK